MSEILKRSITGALYIAVIVSTAFLSHYLLLLFFTIVGFICLREFQTLLKFRNIISYVSLVVLFQFHRDLHASFDYLYGNDFSCKILFTQRFVYT